LWHRPFWVKKVASNAPFGNTSPPLGKDGSELVTYAIKMADAYGLKHSIGRTVDDH